MLIKEDKKKHSTTPHHKKGLFKHTTVIRFLLVQPDCGDFI